MLKILLNQAAHSLRNSENHQAVPGIFLVGRKAGSIVSF
jgi:hypothetical protein